MSSAHTKTKKLKSVNLCLAQLISAQLRRAHGQKTNKKTRPRSRRPYLFFDPNDNTVLAYISKIVQDRGLVTIIHILEAIYEISFGMVFFDLQ